LVVAGAAEGGLEEGLLVAVVWAEGEVVETGEGVTEEVD
jgi:hypothetical protein